MPDHTPPKPAKDVWKRLFSGEATPEDKEDFFKSGPAAVEAVTEETNFTLARKAYWSGKGE